MYQGTMKCGTPFEITDSSKCNGPDSECTLNFGRSYLYYRIDGGEWISAPVQLGHRTKDWLESINADEVSLYENQCQRYELIQGE